MKNQKMENQKTWQVYSPDSLPIAPEEYSSQKEAIAALKKWINRYKLQGYYSAANGLKIPVSELFDYCDIVEN
jgi:hypothetical protein